MPVYYNQCIDACYKCASACDICAASWVNVSGPDTTREYVWLSTLCANICRMAARHMASGSEIVNIICQLCADLCQKFSNQYDNSQNEECKLCVQACLHCVQACRAVIIAVENTQESNFNYVDK